MKKSRKDVIKYQHKMMTGKEPKAARKHVEEVAIPRSCGATLVVKTTKRGRPC